MRSSSSLAESAPERLMPAWVISLLAHSGLIALLFFVVKPWPQGGAEGPGSSLGIVLNTASSEGDLNLGEDDSVEAVSAEQAAPADLMSVFRSEFEKTDIGADMIQLPTPNAVPVAGRGQQSAAQLTNGGRRGSPLGGGDANVSVFGVEGTGNKFVYLFDRSSSMEGAPLAAAKRQLLESLASLESVHQFHVIFFNTKTHSFDAAGSRRRIASATDRNKQLAANFVGGISADGGTDRLSALREAIAFAPDVIFFLSDADDPMTPSELAEIDEANRRAHAAICVIEFGRRNSPMPENFLMKLARESGGQYGYVNTASLTK